MTTAGVLWPSGSARQLGWGRWSSVLGLAAAAGAFSVATGRYEVGGALLLGVSWLIGWRVAEHAPRWHLALALAALLAMGPMLLTHAPAWGTAMLLLGCSCEAAVGLFGQRERGRVLRHVVLAVALLFVPLAADWGWATEQGVSAVVALWAFACLARAAHALGLRVQGRPEARAQVWGRGGALRSAVAGASATAVDFALFHCLLLVAVYAPAATLVGCVVGAVVNFTLNRSYSFDSSGPVASMALRYAVVSGLSALFNAGLVAVLILAPSMQARLAWLVARGLVFLVWNYPLQRDVVFQHRS